jgi:hypothetical protein
LVVRSHAKVSKDFKGKQRNSSKHAREQHSHPLGRR